MILGLKSSLILKFLLKMSLAEIVKNKDLIKVFLVNSKKTNEEKVKL